MPKKSPSVPAPYQEESPIRCVECGAKEVRPAILAYRANKNYDGRIYEIDVPHLSVRKCAKCEEVYFGSEADKQITEALRRHLRLLSPGQIKQNLRSLQLTQKQFAHRLGVAPETMSRWLKGRMIQPRLSDNMMRLYFRIAAVRDALARLGEESSDSSGGSEDDCASSRSTNGPNRFALRSSPTLEGAGSPQFRGEGDPRIRRRSQRFSLTPIWN
jgi:DNA-binding transcriptional regulator YiaG